MMEYEETDLQIDRDKEERTEGRRTVDVEQ